MITVHQVNTLPDEKVKELVDGFPKWKEEFFKAKARSDNENETDSDNAETNTTSPKKRKKNKSKEHKKTKKEHITDDAASQYDNDFYLHKHE
jgi:hypothetical protein